MRFTDLNRSGGIGASAMLVEIGTFRFLIDAGIHPKKTGLESIPDYSLIEASSLDFVILTHCHLDHLGSLPVLMRRQPQARVLVSVPSRTLAGRMLYNSCNIMKRQRRELGIPELPLYTRSDVEPIEHRMLPMAYDRSRTFYARDEKIEITFFQAGHVVGASGLRIKYKHRKIFFTGDVLFTPQRILPAARFPKEEFDTLVMETTRGLTERPQDTSRESETERFIHTINHVLSRGGSVLVPVFALGRMQEILSLINEARKAGRLHHCPVYCSGLGIDLAHFLDRISRKTGLAHFHRKILKDLHVRPLPHNLKPGRNPTEQGLYVVSSGMLVENTPSYNVTAAILGHHKNAICFVGYCDPDTPGGKLLATRSGDTFRFDALDYLCPIRARIERFDMSSHADREELLAFALAANPRVIVLTHGDPEARAWFYDSLTDLMDKTKLIDPTPLQPYLL